MEAIIECKDCDEVIDSRKDFDSWVRVLTHFARLDHEFRKLRRSN